MGRLREVSDDWLAQKTGAEKGFSVGFFEPAYLERFPVAVVERDHRIVAFANIWPGPGEYELSIDLMRYDDDAPTSVMESLIVHLLVWGQEQGYHWFALGMAPMSGAERLAGGAAPCTRRELPLRARRIPLQFPRVARLQREVQPDLGAALSRVSRSLEAAGDRRRRVGACRRRLRPHLSHV